MDAVTKPRNVAIFDDWKHCVAYVPHLRQDSTTYMSAARLAPPLSQPSENPTILYHGGK